MKMFRVAGVMAGLLISLMLAGCGDTYRPVITPFPTETPNPKNASLVVVANEGVNPNGSVCVPADPCPGSTTDIDVPGDINIGNHVIGDGPSSAVLIGSALYTANRNSNTVSTYSPFLTGQVPNTVSLNQTASVQIDNSGTQKTVTVAPSFVATTQGTSVFVAMPACTPATTFPCAAFDPSTPGVLSVISTASNQVVQTLQMDLNPVAMAEFVNGSKLYVVNQGPISSTNSDGTVVVVNAVNNTILSPAATASTPPRNGIEVGVSPVWAVTTSDSNFVFVLNRGSNTVSVLSAASDSALLKISTDATGSATLDALSVGSQVPVKTPVTVPPTPLPTPPVQYPMVWDNVKTRLYVTNPGDDTVSIFDGTSLGVVPVNAPLARFMPLLKTVPLPKGSHPFSIAVLSDGSRAYVLNTGDNTMTPPVLPSVSIIDATSFVVSTVPGFLANDPRGIIASSDGTKVYVVYHEPIIVSPTKTIPPGTMVIRTLDNSILTDSTGALFPIAAPFQDPVNCTVDGPTCPRQRPVLIVAQ
jgi:DNA-binding beta-propeller fold protein YncE